MSTNTTPLVVGMKVRIISGDAPDPRVTDWHLYRNWIAGRVPIGAVGTVGQVARPNDYMQWVIDFPDYPVEQDKAARGFERAILGPNVPYWLEVMP